MHDRWVPHVVFTWAFDRSDRARDGCGPRGAFSSSCSKFVVFSMGYRCVRTRYERFITDRLWRHDVSETIFAPRIRSVRGEAAAQGEHTLWRPSPMVRAPNTHVRHGSGWRCSPQSR